MPIWFLTNKSKTYVGEKTPSSINDSGQTGYPYIEEWTRSLSLILYESQFKIAKYLNYKTWKFEIAAGKERENASSNRPLFFVGLQLLQI
jgi:hypothetical protein